MCIASSLILCVDTFYFPHFSEEYLSLMLMSFLPSIYACQLPDYTGRLFNSVVFYGICCMQTIFFLHFLQILLCKITPII